MGSIWEAAFIVEMLVGPPPALIFAPRPNTVQEILLHADLARQRSSLSIQILFLLPNHFFRFSLCKLISEATGPECCNQPAALFRRIQM
jgi:hypothetical protein